MSKKLTHEEFMAKFEEKQPELFAKTEVLGEYVRMDIKIPCACKVCGHGKNGEDWKPRPSSLLTGKGCPKCAYEKQRKTHEEFVEELSKINPNIEVLEDYKNAHTGIKCKCKVCGYGEDGNWRPQPSHLLEGKGCPKCAYRLVHEKLRKTHEDFIKELSEINPNVKVLGDYVNTHTGISCECLLCGHGKNGEDWKPQPNSLLEGHGCPKCCAGSNTSWLQEQLFEYFSQKYPSTLYRDKTLIDKELDIVIPELNIAIEPGSWHWHFEVENKLSDDYQKQLLCKEKGYTCITLYDKCDFPDVLWYPALIYNENLSKKHENLSQVIQDIEQIIQDHA